MADISEILNEFYLASLREALNAPIFGVEMYKISWHLSHGAGWVGSHYDQDGDPLAFLLETHTFCLPTE